MKGSVEGPDTLVNLENWPGVRLGGAMKDWYMCSTDEVVDAVSEGATNWVYDVLPLMLEIAKLSWPMMKPLLTRFCG